MKINLNKTIVALGISALTSVALAQDQNYNNGQNNGQRMYSDTDANTPVTAQHFVWEAATTDMKEIHLGELALQKSDNADVKSFAKHLISDHKKACKKLQAITERENLNFPDTNSLSMTGWHTNNWNGNSNWNSNTAANAGMDTNNPTTDSSAGIGHQNYKGAEILELANSTATNVDNEAGEVNLEILSGSEFDQAYVNKMVLGHEKAISKFETAAANLQDPDLKKYAEKTLPTLRHHLEMAQDLQNKLGATPNSPTNSTSSMPMGTPQ